MRLSPSQIQDIKQTIHHYDPIAQIFLFGSRVDDTKKGGDIDLLVLSKTLNMDDQLNIKIQLFDKLGEQKIDLVIADKPKTAFLQMALKQGIPL
jgi:predicted nucleotidyltransferase